MNVIFLDIDGVMNSNDFYNRKHHTIKKRIRAIWLWIRNTPRWVMTGKRTKTYNLSNCVIPEKRKTFEYKFNGLKEDTDPIKWEWLSEFCNRTDTKVCISSRWKWYFNGNSNTNNEMWNKAFDKLGFNSETFIGITGNRRTLRSTEIKEFIEYVNDGKHPFIPYIEKYAIIDDDSDMLPEQLDSFFHVDGYYGLSPNTLYKIGRHFNKNIKNNL